MNFPAELKYTKDHEWIKVEGDVAIAKLPHIDVAGPVCAGAATRDGQVRRWAGAQNHIIAIESAQVQGVVGAAVAGVAAGVGVVAQFGLEQIGPGAAHQAVFALVQFAGGELDHHRLHGVAELALQHHAAAVQQTDDHDRARVQHVLARGLGSIGHAHRVANHV